MTMGMQINHLSRAGCNEKLIVAIFCPVDHCVCLCMLAGRGGGRAPTKPEWTPGGDGGPSFRRLSGWLARVTTLPATIIIIIVSRLMNESRRNERKAKLIRSRLPRARHPAPALARSARSRPAARSPKRVQREHFRWLSAYGRLRRLSR
jgi:hypothetical protein